MYNIKEVKYKMIIKTKDFQESYKKILEVVDTISKQS